MRIDTILFRTRYQADIYYTFQTIQALLSSLIVNNQFCSNIHISRKICNMQLNSIKKYLMNNTFV